MAELADYSNRDLRYEPIVGFMSRRNYSKSRINKAPGATFFQCDFTLTDFNNADLEGVTFKDCELLGTKFTAAQLSRVTIVDCRIRELDVSRANLDGADLTQTSGVNQIFGWSLAQSANGTRVSNSLEFNRFIELDVIRRLWLRQMRLDFGALLAQNKGGKITEELRTKAKKKVRNSQAVKVVSAAKLSKYVDLLDSASQEWQRLNPELAALEDWDWRTKFESAVSKVPVYDDRLPIPIGYQRGYTRRFKQLVKDLQTEPVKAHKAPRPTKG